MHSFSLVCAVPRWPAEFSDQQLSPIVDSGIRCGQSFGWITLPRTPELAHAISGHIRLMGAYIYAARVTPDDEAKVSFAEDRIKKRQLTPYDLVAPHCIQLGPGVWHVAKVGRGRARSRRQHPPSPTPCPLSRAPQDAKWGQARREGRPTPLDFYQDCLAVSQPFLGEWRVQSWLNGDVSPFGRTQHVENILQIRLPDGAVSSGGGAARARGLLRTSCTRTRTLMHACSRGSCPAAV